MPSAKSVSCSMLFRLMLTCSTFEPLIMCISGYPGCSAQFTDWPAVFLVQFRDGLLPDSFFASLLLISTNFFCEVYLNFLLMKSCLEKFVFPLQPVHFSEFWFRFGLSAAVTQRFRIIAASGVLPIPSVDLTVADIVMFSRPVVVNIVPYQLFNDFQPLIKSCFSVFHPWISLSGSAIL